MYMYMYNVHTLYIHVHVYKYLTPVLSQVSKIIPSSLSLSQDYFAFSLPLPLSLRVSGPPSQAMVEEGLVSTDGGGAVDRAMEDEGDEDEAFFDAVEVSSDDWVKSKSVSFKPVGGGGEEGGEREKESVEAEGGVKFGHKRNASGVSVNEAQLLLSSPEPEQLPTCSERTMSVSCVCVCVCVCACVCI